MARGEALVLSLMASKKAYTLFFYLWALESVAATATLFLIPSEGGTLSPARLMLIAIPLALSVIWTYAALRFSGDLNRLAHPSFIIFFVLLSLAFGLALFLLRYLDPGRYLSLYQRLSPLLWYFLLLFIQMSFYLLYLYGGLHPQKLYLRKRVNRYALNTFIILLIVFIFISVTRLGLTYDPAYWGEPGVPMAGWQLGLALIGGIFIFCVGIYRQVALLDLILPIGIYLLTLVICLSVPINVLQNSFYMPITAPARTPFPYADSAYYDQMAQSVSIGHPYQGVVPTRPLYVLFLIILHLLFGQNYSLIIAGQTFVLAFIPVVLYSLGRKLHSRTAGVVIALFFIFRELTSLLISSETRVTNTKMILVDLPTLFLLLLSCLFVFRWFERKGWLDAFAAGGIFGALLLLRTQSMLILPFIILAALAVLGWRNRTVYRDISFFLFGMVLSILPWLIHNYLLAGEFAFDAAFENQLLVNQYLYQGNSAIQNLNVEDMGLARVLIEFALRDPKHVFGFIANHFLATHVNSLLALPLIEPFNGIFAPINLYWMSWDGHTTWYNAFLLIMYIAIIALGVGAACSRWQWMGLLPLIFSVGYALATAVSRYSSWRYDYPSDWISYFYFGVGFAELLSQGAVLFGAEKEIMFDSDSRARTPPKSSSTMRGIILGLIFILIGASPWMVKNISSPRYADQSVETLESRLVSISGTPTRVDIQAFDSQPDSFFQSGRLLYPRFFREANGLSSATPSPAYMIREFPRLGFMLLNQTLTPAVFPIRKVPGPIPHAADVIVLGCQREDYVEVRLIAFPALDAIHMSAPLSEPCSD
jgi:hypothetical protein